LISCPTLELEVTEGGVSIAETGMKAHIINSGDFFPACMDGPPKFLLVYSASRKAIILEREHEHDTDAVMREKARELEASVKEFGRREVDRKRRTADT
jgi:hypothetical protein